MGRPKGSRNKSRDDNGGFGGDQPSGRNTVSGAELRAYLERIEYCDERRSEIADDLREIFKELKGAGYDAKTIRALVRDRKLTAEQREAADALMDQYRSALGDFAGTPLGQAGADRVREEANVG